MISDEQVQAFIEGFNYDRSGDRGQELLYGNRDREDVKRALRICERTRAAVTELIEAVRKIKSSAHRGSVNPDYALDSVNEIWKTAHTILSRFGGAA